MSASQTYVGFSQVRQFATYCGAIPSDSLHYSTKTPRDVSYDPKIASNANVWEEFDIRFQFDSIGQSGCWPNTVAAKYTRVDFSIHDSSGNVSWINGQGNLNWSGRPVTPDSGWTVDYTTGVNRDLGGGWKYIGWFVYNWPTQTRATFDVIVPLVVTDQLAQYHAGDTVQLQITFTIGFDTFNCGWWGWCGNQRAINDQYSLNSTLTARSQ